MNFLKEKCLKIKKLQYFKLVLVLNVPSHGLDWEYGMIMSTILFVHAKKRKLKKIF